MKQYIYIGLVALIVSCTSSKKEKESATIEKQTTHTHEAGTQTHAHTNEIHLNDAQIAAANIQTGKIEKREIRERINVTGTIEVPPQSKATIYAPMEAFVHTTELLPGDKVQKGQTVAILQHPNFTKLQYAFLKATNEEQVLKADYERKKMLLENDIASKKSFQIAKSAYKTAQSLVVSLGTQLQMSGLDPKTIQQKGIQQLVRIKAPISGYVVENNLNKGKFLAANEEMMKIIDTDHMHAELNVFGTDIHKVQKGATFTFKPSGIDTGFEGYVKLISQSVTKGSRTVNVHGHFEDEKGILKEGTFINAEILTTSDRVFAVPEEAIIENEGENFIFVAESDKEFIPVAVTLGNTDNGFVAIKTIADQGFKVNIVVKGAHFLKGKLLELSGNMEGHAH